jgi:hypothetical protein
VYAVTASNSDRDSPWRIIPLSVIISFSHNEDAVAADAKAGKRALALLTHVAMNGHEILCTIHKHYSRLWADMRKETRNEV